MKNPFTKHPHSLNEAYFEHMIYAAKFGFEMIIGGLACIVHAIFPFLFIKTGSNFLLKMTQSFVERMPIPEERVVKLSKIIRSKMLFK